MDPRPENAFLSVVMPEELKRWVRVEAAQRDMSASAYVRELVVKERDIASSQSGIDDDLRAFR